MPNTMFLVLLLGLKILMIMGGRKVSMISMNLLRGGVAENFRMLNRLKNLGYFFFSSGISFRCSYSQYRSVVTVELNTYSTMRGNSSYLNPAAIFCAKRCMQK